MTVPPSGPSSVAESVATTSVLPNAAARSPLGFLLLQVLRLLAVRAPSRPFRSWPFATPTEVSVAWVFSVFSAWEPNRSLSRPADLPEVSCLPDCSDEASAGSLSSPQRGSSHLSLALLGTLSVAGEYLALRDGPRSFRPASTCPVLLRCQAGGLPPRIRDCHPLWSLFPERFCGW